jgi:hypothetical protein
MNSTKHTRLLVIVSFLLGFGFGGTVLHYAHAQGLMGLTASVNQIGGALGEMQKNIDGLQKNMTTIKQAKEQLSKLPSSQADTIKKEEESLKNSVPGMGR